MRTQRGQKHNTTEQDTTKEKKRKEKKRKEKKRKENTTRLWSSGSHQPKTTNRPRRTNHGRLSFVLGHLGPRAPESTETQKFSRHPGGELKSSCRMFS